MANIDGRPLDLAAAGAVLFLTQPTKRAWIEHLPHGVDVSTAEGSRAALVSGLGAGDAIDSLVPLARQLANEALDLMALRSIGVHTLMEIDSPTLAWSRASGRLVLRTTTFVHAAMGMTIGGPPNPGPTDWHQSMRYFRLSQTTTDLFDAFRNLYLALESILDKLEPFKLKPNGRPAEGEGVWLRRALGAAERRLLQHNSALKLGRYLNPSSQMTGHQAIDGIMGDLYERVRTNVFHAKNSRPVAVPQHEPDRAVVADALHRYARLYFDLADAILGARFLTSGPGAAIVEDLATDRMPRWVLGASPRVWDTLDDFDQGAAESLLPMRTMRAPSYDVPFSASVIGELDSSDFPADLVVRSVGVRDADGNSPITVESIGGDLTLGSVDRWEHLATLRMFGTGLKATYAS